MVVAATDEQRAEQDEEPTANPLDDRPDARQALPGRAGRRQPERRRMNGTPMPSAKATRSRVPRAAWPDAAAMVTGTLLGVDGGNLALNAGGSHTWHTA